MPQKFINPKEKAKELIDKYSNIEIQIGGQYDGYMSMDKAEAKECALFVVKEIIEELKEFDTMDGYSVARMDFWDKVKSELESPN
jgi:hypothetical protein